MVFKSEAQLRRYVLDKCKVAVAEAQAKAYRIIDTFLNNYYDEFTPAEYIRTHQLLHSLVQTNVKSTGAGFVAEVYFDASKLNYPNPARGKSGMYHSADYSGAEVLASAMHGSHGGWKDGTAIWDKSMVVLNAQMIDILKHSLIANGIPIS